MYAREIDERVLTFRFHPDLLKRNLLLEDLGTGSVWSQLERASIRGPLSGKRLAIVPFLQTSWIDWRKRHPDTLVLEPAWGYWPYRYVAPSGREARGLSRFAVVLGIELGGVSKAYPLDDLATTAGAVEDRIGDRSIRILYSADGYAAYAEDPQGNLLPGITVYWGNWLEFHPETALWRSR